jgi:U32 family peptidase
MGIPELLVPAGNLEKLKIALTYGADAVYVGTSLFGLRKYAPNFTLSELRHGIEFAHQRNKRVYIVLNSFAHIHTMDTLPRMIDALADLNPDAFIISDRGVFELARARCSVPLHVSTQASVTNAAGCAYWKSAGAKRVILAREVSINACKAILEQVPVELEVFIHGAMCASYSGKCVISNYTAARDSNRGGCVQSCRHRFGVHTSSMPRSEAHIMNAQDLMGVHHIQAMLSAGIHSVKIEGRMKSNLYVAQVSRLYRQAIDRILQDPEAPCDDLENELATVSNRTFSDGFLDRPQTACNTQFTQYSKSLNFLGTVQALDAKYAYVHLKQPFTPDTPMQWITPTGTHEAAINTLNNAANTPLRVADLKPNCLIKVERTPTIVPYSILTQPVS